MLNWLVVSPRVSDLRRARAHGIELRTCQRQLCREIAGNGVVLMRQSLEIGDAHLLHIEVRFDPIRRLIRPVLQSHAGGKGRTPAVSADQGPILYPNLGRARAYLEASRCPLTALNLQVLSVQLRSNRRPLHG